MFNQGIRTLLQLPVKKLSCWPMRELTSLRVGGAADLVLFPADLEELRKVVATARACEVPLHVIGEGTNLLVNDEGVSGAMISLTMGFNALTAEKNGEEGGAILKAGAGVNMGKVRLFAFKQGLAGLEGLSGIPGSLGGCLTMNAGAGTASIGQVVNSVKILTENGELVTVTREEINYGYRSADYPVDGILIEAELNMTSAHRGDLQEKLMRTASRRRSSRYVPPFNAGSIFKNPPHRSAGNLIDRCLLKGLREGDAQIYGGHGNIIVNLGNATSTHILKLIATVKEAVYKRSGIELEEEIRIL